MTQKNHLHKNLDHKINIMRKFFSEYYRKTMPTDNIDPNIDFTILELNGLAAFTDTNKEYTITQLSVNSSLSMPNTTAIIARLENKGMVSRKHDKRDRRVVRVRLTPKGKEMLQKFMQMRGQQLANTLGKLSDRDQNALLSALEKAFHIFEKISYG